MTKPPLGRLEKVDLRKYWESESSDFTPWLAREDNIALLSEALGMELEVEDVEKDVGTFRADILCKDIATDKGVLIENQLEKTNHGHLGQIITYAAGLDVRTVVWIARTFTEEHREALIWLNEVSQDGLRFFGLEIELWKIGESAPAPKFNIVAKPNDWAKAVRGKAEEGGISEWNQGRLEFWSLFCDLARKKGTKVRVPEPRPRPYMRFTLGRSGISISAVASTFNTETNKFGLGELRAQLLIQNRNAQAAFHALMKDREQIEKDFGGKLEWSESEEVNRRRIFVRRDADVENKAHWPEQAEWLLAQVENLHRSLAHRVRALRLEDQNAGEG
ncbi:MAG: DUF4268 domain-containing protein [Burkholderiales bacterium]|nr:DUF4268 domain-containing protein [Burkholderiales bacterium]